MACALPISQAGMVRVTRVPVASTPLTLCAARDSATTLGSLPGAGIGAVGAIHTSATAARRAIGSAASLKVGQRHFVRHLGLRIELAGNSRHGIDNPDEGAGFWRAVCPAAGPLCGMVVSVRTRPWLSR